MDKFKAQVSTTRPLMDITQLVQQLTTQKKEHKTRFLVKKGSRFYSVETKDVSHIYTKERVHFIKTFNGTDYIIDSNLDELETELDPAEFYRANRQFIINFKAIAEVIAWFDGKLKVILKPAAYEDLIISRLKANEFKKWLSK
jgi:DNA-binding LytR/AlgR family response regulator